MTAGSIDSKSVVWVWLPCVVLRSVECGSGALAVDVEDVLAAEGVGVRVVLVGAQAPIGVVGHGVDGDLS